MEDELHEFTYTEDRAEIMRELLELTRRAEAAAELVRGKGYPDDAHKLRNVAQAARSRRCLMAQTFALEDEARAAG